MQSPEYQNNNQKMQMQILKYVHIKIRKGSKEKSSDHSCLLGCLFVILPINNTRINKFSRRVT